MKLYVLDYETRSQANIKVVGGVEYARHPSTEVLFGFWKAFETPTYPTFFTADCLPPLFDEAARGEAILLAYNAEFEMAITRYVLGIDLPPEAWRDLYADTRVAGGPANLHKSMEWAYPGLKQAAKADGTRLITRFCIPVSDGKTFIQPEDDRERWAKFVAYGKQDVIATDLLASRVMVEQDALTKRGWWAHCRVNQRGVKVDRELAQSIVNQQRAIQVDAEIRCEELTGGLKPTQVGQLLTWFDGQIPNLQKATVEDYIEQYPDSVGAEVLQCRLDATGQTAAKAASFLEQSGSDGRVRGAYSYLFANTGRWSSRGINIQNIKKGSLADRLDDNIKATSALIKRVKAGSPEPGDARHYPTLLRSCFVPDKQFKVTDFDSIEAVLVAWLCGDQGMIDRYHAGEDVYCYTYERMFDRTITKNDKVERGLGKLSSLAFGYGGGYKAWLRFNDGSAIPKDLTPTDDAVSKYRWWLEEHWPSELEKARTRDQQTPIEASIKWLQENERTAQQIMTVLATWRETFYQVPETWQALEDAAANAVDAPGTMFKAARCRFMMQGRTLVIKLPSGRCLYRNQTRKGDWFVFDGHKGYAIDYYGGRWLQNITQALASDYQRLGIIRSEEAGIDVVMHTHDELIHDTDASDDAIQEALMTPAPWAPDLRLRGDTVTLPFYMKI